jgi:hypothetical protein
MAAVLTPAAQELSEELLVAREIYELQVVENKIPHFDLLANRLEKLMGREDISHALDILFDQGMLRTQWEKVEGKNVRGLRVAREALGYVEFIYKNTQ